MISIVSFQWVPPPQENIKEKEADEQIAIDLGDEYEQALSSATQEEIIDLAGKIDHFRKSIVLELKDKQLYVKFSLSFSYSWIPFHDESRSISCIFTEFWTTGRTRLGRSDES